jgi:hypothetical protein
MEKEKKKNSETVIAQEWLDQIYPNKETTSIILMGLGLEGELNFSNYPNLEKIMLENNNLTSVNFLNTLSNPKKLNHLEV